MRRKLFTSLLEWKANPNRKPLIINGARQVGKTYLLEEFGRTHFENTIYVNFEYDKEVVNFINDEIRPQFIIQFLEIIKKQTISKSKTLIIFDEIQACERALTSLKYFCEQAEEYHIVAAGSLLGVAINRKKYSYPVGKVDTLNMFPLDFEEFLWATNNEKLSNIIASHFEQNKAVDSAYHSLALDLYNKYLIVGGMPEPILTLINTNSFVQVQQVQNKILNEYIADMAKYSEPSTCIKIRACFDSIPAQLAKENTKFQYKVVMKGGSSTIFGEAIEWLLYSGIILKCNRIEQGISPILVYKDLINFKIYCGDVGLLTLKSNIPLQTILSGLEVDNTFLGALAENFIAQTFACKQIPLLFWHSEGKAEIDFVIQKESDVIPIEVKSGKRVKSKSLSVFTAKYKCKNAIRISKKNFGVENNIISVPLYAAHLI